MDTDEEGHMWQKIEDPYVAYIYIYFDFAWACNISIFHTIKLL